jgi:hypothetical protein
MTGRKPIRRNDEAASRFAPKRGYDGFDFGFVVNGRCDQRRFERAGGRLELGQ